MVLLIGLNQKLKLRKLGCPSSHSVTTLIALMQRKKVYTFIPAAKNQPLEKGWFK